MTIRHLKIFLALYQTKSTTLASKKLLVAQPTVSIALKELEDYYNVKFFDRFSQRLHLTQAGEEFYQYAKHIIDLLDETDQRMKEIGENGDLRVGTSITIGNYFLPKYIKAFEKEYPSAKIKVFIDNSNNIVKLLLENKIDIGLIEGQTDNSFILVEPYFDDTLCMVCSPEHSYAKKKEVNPEDILNEKFILREKGSAVRELFDIQMANVGLHVVPIWQSISSNAIIRAVKENIGISVLPYFLVKDHIEKGELCTVKVKKLNFSRTFNIICHRNKFHTLFLDRFIEICKKIME